MERKRSTRIAVAAAAAIVCLAALFIIDDDGEPAHKKKRSEDMPYMKNNALYVHLGPPEFALEKRINLASIMRDPNRNYCKVFTSMEGWEFFRLAEHLKPHIEVSRSDRRKSVGNRIKYDFYHRLYFVLHWLVTGLEYKQIEAFYGWSKSAVQLELVHMLQAIIHGLDSFLKWPDAAERAIMASQYTGLFKDCVGIMDAAEHPIRKAKNKDYEISTYSGHFTTFSSFHVLILAF